LTFQTHGQPLDSMDNTAMSNLRENAQGRGLSKTRGIFDSFSRYEQATTGRHGRHPRRNQTSPPRFLSSMLPSHCWEQAPSGRVALRESAPILRSLYHPSHPTSYQMGRTSARAVGATTP
jgi:hypothetical protein